MASIVEVVLPFVGGLRCGHPIFKILLPGKMLEWCLSGRKCSSKSSLPWLLGNQAIPWKTLQHGQTIYVAKTLKNCDFAVSNDSCENICKNVGDPLMPALFSLGQHQALQAAHAQLQAGETLYAFLDDIYVTVSPERVRPVYDLLSTSCSTTPAYS